MPNREIYATDAKSVDTEVRMIVEKAFSHISYTLDNDKYSKLALKMLSNSMSQNIIKPISIRNNGARRLLYSVKDLKSLASCISELDNGLIFSVIYHYKEVIREIESQTYLKKEFLELDPDRVFIDFQTREVKFIIIPVLSQGESDGHIRFLEKNYSFISAVLGINDHFEDSRLSTLLGKCTYLREHENAIPGRVGYLEDILSFVIKEFDEDAVINVNDEYVKVPDSVTSKVIREIELHHDGAYGTFSLYITKSRFTIGKSANNDGVLAMNPAVSRSHLMIEVENNTVYVTDSGSRNHTFVNGAVLTVNEKVPIENSSILRIADMDFEVIFNYG